MALADLAIFALALLLAAASPGPGLAAIVANVLARGARRSLPFVTGVALGDVVWLGLAVGGLAMLAQTFQTAFLLVKWAGVAYLLVLAVRLWRAGPAKPSAEPPSAGEGWMRLLAGLSVTMGNPKVMVFYLALLPSVVDLRAVDAAGFLALAATILAVLALVFGVYVLVAERARSLFVSPRAQARMNRAAAAAMTGAAAWIAVK